MSEEALAATLDAIHTVAEHVLAAARYQAEGHIGLTVIDGSFATPPYGSDDRTLAIVGSEIVSSVRGHEQRAALTTLRAAGDFAGITAGAPAQVYKPATAFDLDASITIDPVAAKQLADWYRLGAAALQQLAGELADENPSGITLWPEHFDVAIRVGDVNYGAIGGDASIPTPYLYVGPTGGDIPNEPADFWNAPFGAARTWHDVAHVDDAVAFFLEGHRLTADRQVSGGNRTGQMSAHLPDSAGRRPQS